MHSLEREEEVGFVLENAVQKNGEAQVDEDDDD